MPKGLFATLLIPPPEKAIDREAALSWLAHNLPQYESLASHLSRRFLRELEEDVPADVINQTTQLFPPKFIIPFLWE